MVISYLTIYAIVFSCVALLGRPFAMTTLSQIEVTSFKGGTRPADGKIHFRNHVKTNSSSKNEISVTPGKHSDAGDFASPKNFPDRLNPTRGTYFASFDPVKNVTKKLAISGRYSNSTNDKDSIWVRESSGGLKTVKNFIQWDTLRDHEKEIRIHYGGLTAKETLMSTGVDEETGKRQGLKLRQLTDGTHFIQLIYNFNNEIQDCEYIRQKGIVRKFLSSFRDNVEKAKIAHEAAESPDEEDALISHDFGQEEDDDYIEEDKGKIEGVHSEDDSDQYEGEEIYYSKDYRNVTFQIIRDGENLPREFAEWMNYPNLRRKCRENHRVLKQLVYNRNYGDARAKRVAEEHIERVKRNLDFSLVFPGTKWCGKSHTAEKYTALGGFSKTDKCCRTHDHCHPYIPAFEERYGFYNYRPYTLGHCRCDLRRKRDIMDVLLVPGTKWCGKGRRATKYTSLGGFSRTDKCCRIHDTMCPHWIGSLEQKYGLFNWRINTIMHCRCDKRFRACLKMAKTGTANFVGKLFFNVVQTKCFVLKPQEVCLKYSWWGKCEKKEYRKKAYLKDNLSY